MYLLETLTLLSLRNMLNRRGSQCKCKEHIGSLIVQNGGCRVPLELSLILLSSVSTLAFQQRASESKQSIYLSTNYYILGIDFTRA